MGITRQSSGFTIIETMLFLAVTAALAVAILAGTGAAINQQRYRDAVNSLQSYFQDQYSRVSTVANDRTNQYNCDNTAQVTQVGNGQTRGTSDCLILGRFITVDDTGTKLTSSSVVGYSNAVGPQTTDIAALQAYTFGLSSVDTDNTTVSWGATIVKPKTASPEPAGILIVRSPLSGRILTFMKPGVMTAPAQMLDAANTTQPLLMCVSTSSTGVGQPLGVQINPAAAGQSAVEIPTGNSGVCG